MDNPPAGVLGLIMYVLLAHSALLFFVLSINFLLYDLLSTTLHYLRNKVLGRSLSEAALTPLVMPPYPTLSSPS